MIVGFGVILLAFLGATAASLAAPLAVIVGGVMRLRGHPRGGLAGGLLAWVALTGAVCVGLFVGLTGDAGRGVKVHGLELEALLATAPWSLGAAAVAAVAFSVAARRRARREPPKAG